MKSSHSTPTAVLALTLMSASTGLALDFGVSGFASYYDADKAGEAFGGGALVRVGIFDWLAADGRFSYLEIDDTDISLTPLEAAGLFRLPLLNETLVPYGGVGLGYYLFDDSSQAEVDDEVGIFPVVGLDYRFGSEKRWSVFAEARWLFLSSDLESLEGTSDEDIDGVGVNVGVGFKF